MPEISVEQFIESRCSEPSNYVDSYVAFLDMLGFRELCGKKKLSCAEIKSIFDDIDLLKLQCNDRLFAYIVPEDIRKKSTFTIMSDSIVISAPYDDYGLVFLLYLCQFIQNRLLRSKVILRGGIAKGEFFKCGNRMFGPALVEAYRLESTIAIYPRIVISESIISDLKKRRVIADKSIASFVLEKYSKKHMTGNQEITQADKISSHINAFIKKSGEDSLFYVDYFNTMMMLTLQKNSVLEDQITEAIQKGLAHPKDSVRLKYQWVDAYYRRSIKKISLIQSYSHQENSNA